MPLRAAHATVFAVLTALLALALQAKPPQLGARWALRPGAALAVAALIGTGRVEFLAELHRYGVPMIDLDQQDLAWDLGNARL